MAFEVAQLESILGEQAELERQKDVALEDAVALSAKAYRLVIQHLSSLVPSEKIAFQVAEFGSVVGRLVYLVDAVRDLRQDRQSGSFNPLLSTGANDDSEIARSQQNAIEIIRRELTRVGDLAPHWGGRFTECWPAIVDQLAKAAGLAPRSIILYSGFCVPCGDGAIYCDGKDADACGKGCLGTCCCGCCCAILCLDKCGC